MPIDLLPDGTIRQWVRVYDEEHGVEASVPGPEYRPSDPEYEEILVWLIDPEDEVRARAHMEAYRRSIANGESNDG